MCHQMIMGAGKTTIVAPTLGLLLADGRRLVMEVLSITEAYEGTICVGAVPAL